MISLGVYPTITRAEEAPAAENCFQNVNRYLFWRFENNHLIG